jgi:moderate conductance mechanosensitive channel
MGLVVSPGQAQLPSLKDLNLQPSNLLEQKSDNQVVSGCIRLNGRCVFKIADQKSDLPNRINDIEQRLNNISRLYFKNNTSELKIRKQTEGRLPNITIPNSEIKVVANLSSSWSRADLTKCEREIPLSRRHWGMKANQWCGEA